MARSTLVPVTFRFPGDLAPMVHQVAVVGPFNRWDPSSHPLKRTAVGDWTATIQLAPGRTVYEFWVDGVMWLDPADDGREPNDWGSEDSVRYVDPPFRGQAGRHPRSARTA